MYYISSYSGKLISGTTTDIFWKVGINFTVQHLQNIWIDGQVVKKVGDCDGGGVITTKDEKDGLGKNLQFSQTCKKMLRISE